MTEHREVDRRQRGIQRIIATDGNGGRDDVLHFNVKTARAWVTLAGAVFSLLVVVGGGVLAGVKWGIGSEVKEKVTTQIAEECQPGGMIDYHVTAVATELVDEFQILVEDSLTDTGMKLEDLEHQGIDLQAGQTAAVAQLKGLSDAQERNAAELKMLLQDAISNNGGG